jgi:undecaprenyl-diphosphatase
MTDFVYSIILGIVEGITEFLPISSTGHLLVAAALLGFPTEALGVPNPKAFRDTFTIFIQIGAILAVLIYYWRDLWGQLHKLPTDRATQRFWLYVVIAFIPAAVIGFLLRNVIKEILFNPLVVGIALVVGGIVFIVLEARPRTPKTTALAQLSLRDALVIGVAQVTALIPGVSRSGASIFGGLLAGLDRKTATVFSFYLAIPTLGSATIYDLYSALSDGMVQAAQLPYFAVGAAVSFFVALAAIAWLLRYVSNNSFRAFGVYRIIAGAVIIVLALFTQVLAG